MALHERDIVCAVDEARRLRGRLNVLRAAYVTAERSRTGRLRAGWFALTAALLGRETDPLRALGRERFPAIELAAGPPLLWPGEARSAARRRQAHLRTKVAELARNLTEARMLARALATERDAARAGAAELRARVEALRAAAGRSEAARGVARRSVERLQVDVHVLREGLSQWQSAAGALAAERDAEVAASLALESNLNAERATAASLRASLAELQAALERERRSARDVVNASVQLLASLSLQSMPTSTHAGVESSTTRA
jgi:DNA repair exonuclease SbcCD ATPase subunit